MKRDLDTSGAPQVWRQIRAMVDQPSRARVSAIVERDASRLAELFYRQMLADPETSNLLDHELVNTRLHASMINWMRKLFDEATDIDELIALQYRVGDVHADHLDCETGACGERLQLDGLGRPPAGRVDAVSAHGETPDERQTDASVRSRDQDLSHAVPPTRLRAGTAVGPPMLLSS